MATTVAREDFVTLRDGLDHIKYIIIRIEILIIRDPFRDSLESLDY